MIREYKIRKWLLIGTLSAAMLTGCGKSSNTPEDAIKKTAAYEMETVTSPESNTLGGEWTVMALARSGVEVEDSYYEKYRANLEKRVKEQEGILSDNRYTEYSRVTLALTAIGDNPEDVAGYDIKKPLEDYDTVVSQGLNGAVFALLALNADRSDVDGQLQQKYLDFILEKEKPEGGFSLSENTDTADVDITAMTLTCLEPYQQDKDIKETIEKGITFLADAQDKDGGYTAYGAKSSESISQTVIALSTYGVDCNEDSRFKKDGKGLYDRLMEFAKDDGGFAHIPDEDADPMATDQAFCALAAYHRLQEKQNSFYNMTDNK
nr:prenyltransferase/squalene oxidase repeat-containing protein [uncultured Blautia sp.]